MQPYGLMMRGRMASAADAMHAARIGRIAANSALLITPVSFMLDVAAALGWLLGMAVYLFLYILALMTPFVVIYHVLRVLLKAVSRVMPRSRR